MPSIYDITQYTKNPIKRLTLSLLLAFTYGCSTPSIKFHNKASEQHFSAERISTPLFEHIIYTNQATQTNTQHSLHVYLDGDGSPWLSNHWIAKDPTSRNPMILELMAMDSNASILLGRPCYHGLANTKKCHPQYWTSHRYSYEVVQSMRIALKKWLIAHPHIQKINFIGFSGGGGLAALLTPYFPQTTQLITLAANLSIDAWTTQHNYTPLIGSLNPIEQKQLNSQIQQTHIVGAQDKNIPISLVNSYVKKQESAKLLIIESQAHCCWNNHWQSILNNLVK